MMNKLTKTLLILSPLASLGVQAANFPANSELPVVQQECAKELADMDMNKLGGLYADLLVEQGDEATIDRMREAFHIYDQADESTKATMDLIQDHHVYEGCQDGDLMRHMYESMEELIETYGA